MALGFVPVDGGRLYYETSGEGEALLLIHAGVADARMWDAQWQSFAEHYKAIRYDMRCFGRSEASEGVIFTGYQDAAAVLRFLGIDQAIVVGISFGGMVALDFALAYPEMVKALILGAPTVNGEPPSDTLRQFGRDENALLEAGDLDGATELNLRVWVDGPQRTPDQVDAVMRAQVGVMQRAAFEKQFPEGLDEEALEPAAAERLGEIAVPTLVLVGDLDLPDKIASADHIAAAIPGAHHEVISGVAHMLSMERPEVFTQKVLDFLNSVGA